MDRRDFLYVSSAGITSSLAGCTGGSNNDSNDGNNDQSTNENRSGQSTSETTDSDTESGAAGTNWMMAGADAANTYAISSDEVPAQNLTSKWSFESDYDISFPASAGDSIFIYESIFDSENAEDLKIYSLNPDDGSVQWSKVSKPMMTAAPTVTDETLYLLERGDYSEEPDIWISALDPSDGSEQWKYDVGGYTTEPPIVWGGSVYLSLSNKIRAINAEDGTEQWTASVGNVGDDDYTTWPIIGGGNVYKCHNESIHALDPDTGTENWSSEIASAHATVLDDTVFVASDNSTISALDSADGSVIWSYDVSNSESIQGPTATNSTIFFGTESGEVIALDATEGSEKWSSEFDKWMGLPIGGGTKLYVVNKNNIEILEMKDGSKVGSIDTSSLDTSSFYVQPAAFQNTLYLGNEKELVAYQQQ